jgi:hypothetical protein
MRTLILAAGLSATLLSAPASAEEQWGSGNWLLTTCSSEGQYDIGLCHGYISAVARMILSGNHRFDPAPTICMAGVSLGQAEDVVVKYLTGYPEVRHYDAPALISFALENAFPCGVGEAGQ